MREFSGRLVALSLIAVSLSSTLLPDRADALIRASELQSIAQTVDGTTLRVTYSRPHMRGRWPVFGTKAVQWGEVWTPGANWATLLEANKDFTISGVKVPKGKYGVNAAREEMLTWSFPAVSARGGTIAMHWANMRVTMDFAVEPSLSELLSEPEARPCLGTYVHRSSPSGSTKAPRCTPGARSTRCSSRT